MTSPPKLGPNGVTQTAERLPSAWIMPMVATWAWESKPTKAALCVRSNWKEAPARNGLEIWPWVELIPMEEIRPVEHNLERT